MEYAGIALIPLIMGISEVFKRAGIPTKYIPLINLILGLGAGIFLIEPQNIKSGIIQGIYIGLSASGLFSGSKTVVRGFNRSRYQQNK